MRRLDRFRMMVRAARALPKARKWVDGVIASHAAGARPISDLARARLEHQFNRSTLHAVRVSIVDQMPRPPLEEWNLHEADDSSFIEARGLTLRDHVFVRAGEERNESLMFHELVHVIQWRTLGVNRFLAMYGIIMLERGYRENPLEIMAYDLQARFDRYERLPDVEPLIARRTDELVATFKRQSIVHRLALTAAYFM